jgi:hypothetical protein
VVPQISFGLVIAGNRAARPGDIPTHPIFIAGQSGGYYPFPDLHLTRAFALKGQGELSRRHLLKILELGSSHPLQY